MSAAAALKKLYIFDQDVVINEAAPQYTWEPSPNHSSRNGTPIDTVVLHCTAGSSTAGALSRLVDSDEDASSHLLIPNKGKMGEPTATVRLIPDDQAAWHVRKTCVFQNKQGVNSRSLGIEIVNTAQADDPYSDWQVQETARWVRYWYSKYRIKYVVTHAYLDPSRRADPCLTFPWDAFIQDVLTEVHEPLVRTRLLKFLVNGAPVEADGELHENATWGELKPIVTALGATIAYDKATHTVRIQS